MCGIAGFSLSEQATSKGVSKRLAKALLLDIESRGKDATGFAFRDSTGAIQVHKQDVTAKDFVKNRLTLPKRAQTAILHTRAWTQGSPTINENNHPIRTGSIVGVHNGWLTNDDRLWGTLLPKDLRIAEVDSEAIFALLAHGKEVAGLSVTEALQEPEGNLAVAWMDEADEDGTLFLARGAGSPLVVCETQDGSVIFASTQTAIALACAAAGLEPETIRHIGEGNLLTVKGGIVDDVRTFRPTPPAFVSGWTASRALGTATRPTAGIGLTISGITDRMESDSNRIPTRLAQAVTTFDSDEYDRWATERLCALESTPETDPSMPEPYDTRWILRDAFDAALTTELAGESEGVYFAQYAPRERALDKWMDGLGSGTDYVSNLNTARNLKAFIRPGEDVRTRVGGREYDAQVVALPQDFPYGKYLLRVLMPKGSANEVVLVEREHYEFHLIPQQRPLPGLTSVAARTIARTDGFVDSYGWGEPF